jgi:TRAP-type C4-dicarboxylate transport system permease small subunit
MSIILLCAKKRDGMKNILTQIDKNFEKVLISILLILITVFCTMQVILRYCFSNALPWVEEVVVYMHVWIGFIGCSYAMQQDIVLRVDYGPVLPPKVTTLLNAIADFVTVCFYIFICYIGLNVTQTLYNRGQLSPAAEIPMYFVYSSLMIGTGLAVIRWMQRVYRLACNKKN